jgi:hypothetical protein
MKDDDQLRRCIAAGPAMGVLWPTNPATVPIGGVIAHASQSVGRLRHQVWTLAVQTCRAAAISERDFNRQQVRSSGVSFGVAG